MANIDTAIRDKLDATFENKFVKRFDYERLSTFAANKKSPIHRWFSFTQGFAHRIVQKLLKELKISKDNVVLDPFCGVGTTLVTCQESNVRSVGCDISPFFVFIAKTKIQRNYDIEELSETIDQIISKKYETPKVSGPKLEIFTKAFDNRVLNEVLFFKEQIDAIENERIKNFLKLGLASILETVSKTRKHGSHYRFMDTGRPGVKTRIDFNLDVRQILAKQWRMMLSDLRTATSKLTRFSNVGNESFKTPEVFVDDARELKKINDCSVDAIITSPPYLNRNNYIAQYKIESFLFEFTKSFADYRDLTFKTLRSHVEAKKQFTCNFKMVEIEKLLNQIRARGTSYPTIPDMILGYFEDMSLVLRQFNRVCKQGAKIASVVGNVRYSGVVVPVDTLLAKMSLENGFDVNAILITRYKGNSPQQMRKYGRIPVRESIIFMEKTSDIC